VARRPTLVAIRVMAATVSAGTVPRQNATSPKFRQSGHRRRPPRSRASARAAASTARNSPNQPGDPGNGCRCTTQSKGTTPVGQEALASGRRRIRGLGVESHRVCHSGPGLENSFDGAKPASKPTVAFAHAGLREKSRSTPSTCSPLRPRRATASAADENEAALVVVNTAVSIQRPGRVGAHLVELAEKGQGTDHAPAASPSISRGIDSIIAEAKAIVGTG